MSVLWTDLIDPPTLTEYIRTRLVATESDSLARWLPNREVNGIIARFLKGENGLVPVARFRSYDAEPAIGNRPQRKRVTLELPAIGQNIPVSEYEQLLPGTDVSGDEALNEILETADAVVDRVAASIDYLRGIVLSTGAATVDQGDEFQIDDSFGRDPAFTTSVAAEWNDPTVSRLEDLQTLVDLYIAQNGVPPGAILGGQRTWRALAQGDEFLSQLVNGVSRPAGDTAVQDTLTGVGFPTFYRYDRMIEDLDGVGQRIIPDDEIILLPAPTQANNPRGTQLGATFWGRTLTSQDPNWNIAPGDRPGIVAGTYKNPKPPMGVEVISDAIALPVLANANLSMAVKVLDQGS